ncbi:TetR/AcrR family transcriptional regulator C-terminal domain-containing protein [Streptomyces sp. NPDC102467]|uniref:TetR/AcrR family transcriptional regulator C-terminal domain-containing protein n=1 Tax=Streptomyces sp. NPDC102467 TaxID=3366179 RepID=UPI00380C462D
MNKSQSEVAGTALAVLDEGGLEAVSLRAIAERRGVRMNTVVWHVKTKGRLLELMADVIVAEVRLEDLPPQWDRRAEELLGRYRRALLAHRDGAAVVGGTYAPEPATLAIAETLIAALLDGGYPDQEAVWTCWNALYFTLGLCREEQAIHSADPDRLAEAVASGAFPALTRTLPHLVQPSFDDRFAYGLRRLLGPPPAVGPGAAQSTRT